MYKKDILSNLTDEEILNACDNYYSASEFLRTLNMPTNGKFIGYINTRREALNLEWKPVPSKKKIQVCPVCDKEFSPTSGRAQTTCSKACSNTHFRSGKNNPNYNPDKKDYRSICFSARKKKCIICDEDKIVEVHHFDENHENDDINNLIPLCPNHHRYFHSRYRYLVEDQIIKWQKDNII